MSAILALIISIAWATPKADVEGFTDNLDGTATLTIVCQNGNRLEVVVNRKRLDMMDVDAIYALVELNCKDQRKKL